MNDVLDAAKEKDAKYANFDEVLLVGGSCRMPQVKKAVDAALSKNAKMFDPDQAVAKGAAMYAMLKQEFGDLDGSSESGSGKGQKERIGGGGGAPPEGAKKIINVLSQSYGIGSVLSDLKTEVITTMLFKQDEVPIIAKRTFYTVADGQQGMNIDVFEVSATRKDTIMDNGYEKIAVPRADGTLLDGAVLDFGKGFPEDHPVQVTIDLDAEGIMKVHACEEQTGKEINIKIKIEGVRTEEEMKVAITKIAKVKIEGQN